MDFKKRKFYIFRHGETFATVSLKTQRFGAIGAYGRKIYSANILESGKPVLEKMGEFLKDKPTNINFTSPFRRCLQTAEIISEKTGKGFVVDKRLGEYIFGTLYGFKNRVKSILDFIEVEDYTSVAICTHGVVISALKNLILRDDFSFADRNDYPNPGVLWIIDKGEFKEIDFRNKN